MPLSSDLRNSTQQRKAFFFRRCPELVEGWKKIAFSFATFLFGEAKEK
jgi:hypothetical protein